MSRRGRLRQNRPRTLPTRLGWASVQSPLSNNINFCWTRHKRLLHHELRPCEHVGIKTSQRLSFVSLPAYTGWQARNLFTRDDTLVAKKNWSSQQSKQTGTFGRTTTVPSGAGFVAVLHREVFKCFPVITVPTSPLNTVHACTVCF